MKLVQGIKTHVVIPNSLISAAKTPQRANPCPAVAHYTYSVLRRHFCLMPVSYSKVLYLLP
jgi:hypothetical protein